MIFGIIPNITKEAVFSSVSTLINEIKNNGNDYILSNVLADFKHFLPEQVEENKFYDEFDLCTKCDIILSVGGDGTMLSTAYKARHTVTPMAGINLGKLGFLAEYEIENIALLFKELKNKEYQVSYRMALEGYCDDFKDKQLYALNDIVIDKGGWPKMIELSLKIGNDYVTSFAADGLIISTPTGSTGYSLSVGGPIVSPDSEIITISPIAPHTLTMRPLVISSRQEIRIEIKSPHKTVQINCDGQRVEHFSVPFSLNVSKSNNKLRLIHTKSVNYYKTLREKLFWGVDVRKTENT